MRLLFLYKRCPQGRDLIQRPYGRFYHLPRQLAARGHEVHALLLGYRREPDVNMVRDGVHWMVRSLIPYGPLPYWHAARSLTRAVGPDWIIGFSDTYFGILAHRLAEQYGARSWIDAYDNYESYMPWAKPLHWLWRHALSKATRISAAGPGLARLMSRDRAADHALVLPMAADPVFAPLVDRRAVRRRLGLQQEQTLVGYCGSLFPNRGLEVLFAAMERVRALRPEVSLVLSGRRHPRITLPTHTLWLGYIEDEVMPDLVGSLDLLTVINQDSSFGRHSHPVKLYEAMRCGVPVAATRTPATSWILANHPEMLAAPGDAQDLARVIGTNLERRGFVDYPDQTDWEGVSLRFEAALQEPLPARGHG